MMENVFLFSAIEDECQVILRDFLTHRVQKSAPGILVDRMTIDNHAIHVKNYRLQHGSSSRQERLDTGPSLLSQLVVLQRADVQQVTRNRHPRHTSNEFRKNMETDVREAFVRNEVKNFSTSDHESRES